MNRNVIEAVMGAVVLAVAAFFLVFAYRSVDFAPVDGYDLRARFDQIDGLSVGSDVRLSGVKVGSVVDQTLDPTTFLAEVRFTVGNGIVLPTDTVASVSSEGLLGGKFLSLSPGGAEETLQPGGLVEYTQSTPGLEQLLGQVVYNLSNLGKDDDAP